MYEQGYGTANLSLSVPITTSTVFDIASVSKQFTGLTVALLIQKGKLGLDDDIHKYLPELPNFGGRRITIENLLRHTSAIRDWAGQFTVAGFLGDDVFSFDQIIRLANRQRDLNFNPGDEHDYFKHKL